MISPNILIVMSTILIVGYLLVRCIRKDIKNYLHVKYFESYTKLLEYYCLTSYEIFYKKHIMSYTLENLTLDASMLETLERSFVKMTISLMGKNNERLFISYFGGEQFLIDNIIMFIRNKVDHDNIISYAKSLARDNEQSTQSKEIEERSLEHVFTDKE